MSDERMNKLEQEVQALRTRVASLEKRAQQARWFAIDNLPDDDTEELPEFDFPPPQDESS